MCLKKQDFIINWKLSQDFSGFLAYHKNLTVCISFIDLCFNLTHENMTIKMNFNYIKHTCGSSFDLLGINKAVT